MDDGKSQSSAKSSAKTATGAYKTKSAILKSQTTTKKKDLSQFVNVIAVILVVVLSWYSYRTLMRNLDWENEESKNTSKLKKLKKLKKKLKN